LFKHFFLKGKGNSEISEDQGTRIEDTEKN